MGAWRPLKANPYSSPSLVRMKHDLSNAIAVELVENPKAADQLMERVPSIRRAIVRDLVEGRGDYYGMTRLTQIAEALRLRPVIAFKGMSK